MTVKFQKLRRGILFLPGEQLKNDCHFSNGTAVSFHYYAVKIKK